jgi:hypothetical protein
MRSRGCQLRFQDHSNRGKQRFVRRFEETNIQRMLKITNRTLANEVRAGGWLNCIVLGGGDEFLEKTEFGVCLRDRRVKAS